MQLGGVGETIFPTPRSFNYIFLNKMSIYLLAHTSADKMSINEEWSLKQYTPIYETNNPTKKLNSNAINAEDSS